MTPFLTPGAGVGASADQLQEVPQDGGARESPGSAGGPGAGHRSEVRVLSRVNGSAARLGEPGAAGPEPVPGPAGPPGAVRQRHRRRR